MIQQAEQVRELQNELDRVQLTARSTLDSVSKMYDASQFSKKFNLLLQGRIGTGKTTTLGTAPKPLLVHAFEKNTVTTLRNQIDGKTTIVDPRFIGDDIRKPEKFKAWVEEVQRLETAGVFNAISTFAVDSGTVFAKMLINEILKGSPGLQKGGKQRPRQYNAFGLPEMELDDYDTLFNALWDVLNRLCALPCNFIFTVHLEEKMNDYGNLIQRIAIPGASKDKAPILFDELWRAKMTPSSTKPKYEIQTQTDEGFECRTCIGAGGKLDKFEPPNIKLILKKCGWPFEDKELV